MTVVDPGALARHPAGNARFGRWTPADPAVLDPGTRVRVTYTAGPLAGTVAIGTLCGVNTTAVQLDSGPDTLPLILPFPPPHPPARAAEMTVERWTPPVSDNTPEASDRDDDR